ncbi:hypothetical protein K0M31_016723 [Melipona bicolor]|uniref:Uncharacterized protein n=1 Tax=Melipona bicolor TaxID=60889 RepID=A0AA40KEM0_9HYME|nr:hypothetical protein K0M31_016723 [Melipona bicolor]
MFVAQCKNIIESEESSNEEVVSFTKRIINRISSNSDSDDEESHASEDLEEMLELAIAEEEKLTNAGDSLDNIQWNEFANKQQSFTFTGKSGLLMDLPSNISLSEVLSLGGNKPIRRMCVLCYQKKRQILERQQARKKCKKKLQHIVKIVQNYHKCV